MARKPSAPALSKKGSLPLEEDHVGLERLIFFSDAVFAIAMTLLALEIRLPGGESPLTNQELLDKLLSIWPQYFAYILSFLVIGTFWITHHRRFRAIVRYDQRLIWLNMLLLMLVAFVPFPTAVLSQYSNRTGTIFYAATLAMTGFISAAVWLYASHRDRLIAPGMQMEERRHKMIGSLVVPTVFLLSIGLAFIDQDLAKYSWVLIWPALALPR